MKSKCSNLIHKTISKYMGHFFKSQLLNNCYSIPFSLLDLVLPSYFPTELYFSLKYFYS